jgi:hypothetical protein
MAMVEPAKQGHQVGTPERGQAMKRFGIHVIPQENRGPFAKFYAHGGPLTTNHRFVHQIVMDQGGDVDHFHRQGRLAHRLPVGLAELGSQETKAGRTRLPEPVIT